MTCFVLHIGLPKTATSTLQNTLFARHSQIYHLGKARGYTAPMRTCNTAAYKVLTHLLWKLESPFDIRNCQSILEHHILPELTNNQIITASWEGLGTINPDKFSLILERINRIFPEKFRIMIGIRNPCIWITSLYLQSLKGNFKKRNRSFSHTPYIKFDKWLGNGHTHRLRRIEHCAKNIYTASSMLGKDSIGVFPYEELASEPGKYYRNICDFLGIQYDECMEIVSDKIYNPRITKGMLDLMQKTRKSPWLKSRWYMRSENSRRAALSDAGLLDNRPVKITLRPEQKKQINDFTQQYFDYFNSEFNLNLEQYDYPLSTNIHAKQ